MSPTGSHFFTAGSLEEVPVWSHTPCRWVQVPHPLLLSVSIVQKQDTGLSIRGRGCESRWGRHHVGAKRRPADEADCNPAGSWSDSTRRVHPSIVPSGEADVLRQTSSRRRRWVPGAQAYAVMHSPFKRRNPVRILGAPFSDFAFSFFSPPGAEVANVRCQTLPARPFSSPFLTLFSHVGRKHTWRCIRFLSG